MPTTTGVYRELSVSIQTGDDSDLSASNPERKILLTQTADREECRKRIHVGASDSETVVDTGIANIKCIYIAADYPVRVRLNGADETQFVLNTNSTPNISCGGSALDACVFAATLNISSIRLQPIASAAQSARVTIIATGDPAQDY